MNPIAPYLLWIKLGAAVALLAGLAGWHVHAVHAAADARGAQVTAERDAIDARNTALANDKLHTENEHVRALQAQLATLQSDLEHLSQENLHAKLDDAQRHADLLSGHVRMRVDVQPAARNSAQAGPAGGAAAAGVDSGTGLEYDLAPGVAAGIDTIRERHNEAVRRLNACVVAYDGLAATVNAPPDGDVKISRTQ